MVPDGMDLMELLEGLASLLSFTDHQCWSAGQGPPDWSLASGMPIHKKGPRPVSLTLVLGKVKEQFTLSVIMQHVQGCQETWPRQPGCLKVRSCLASLILYDNVILLVGERKTVDLVFLSITEGFYTISHSIFLEKLAVHALFTG